MKTNARGNPMLFTRLDPDDKQEAQKIADERFDGNLSMLVRIAVKDFIARIQCENENASRDAA